MKNQPWIHHYAYHLSVLTPLGENQPPRFVQKMAVEWQLWRHSAPKTMEAFLFHLDQMTISKSLHLQQVGTSWFSKHNAWRYLSKEKKDSTESVVKSVKPIFRFECVSETNPLFYQRRFGHFFDRAILVCLNASKGSSAFLLSFSERLWLFIFWWKSQRWFSWLLRDMN
jgi:hypothetical protein